MYILSNKQTGKSLKGMHPNSRVAKKLQMSEVHQKTTQNLYCLPRGGGAEPVPTWPCMAMVVNVKAPVLFVNVGLM